MYKKQRATSTTIQRNTSYVGERIEQKIERIVNNNEPISDGAPLIYTERKEGVLPEHDIRTDRWEIATEAMDKIEKHNKAKREAFQKSLEEKNQPNTNKNTEGGTQSADGTGTKS